MKDKSPIYPFFELPRLFLAYDDLYVRVILQTNGELGRKEEIDALDAVYADDVLAIGTEELRWVELSLYVVERVVENH